ncbi:MAG: hypothetical protein IPK08_07855 [Bacteroidetes bacterium]|nr:hypothetical protein [Bacteroidota bacterium]
MRIISINYHHVKINRFARLLVASLTIVHAQPQLLGNSSNGGNQFGLIFKYTAGNNSFTETCRLQGIAGSGPQEVVQAEILFTEELFREEHLQMEFYTVLNPGTGIYKTMHDFMVFARQSLVRSAAAGHQTEKLYGTT